MFMVIPIDRIFSFSIIYWTTEAFLPRASLTSLGIKEMQIKTLRFLPHSVRMAITNNTHNNKYW
jgi:hypothetical protein